MANNRFPYTPELSAFQVADDAWHAELVRTFGEKAGTARYFRKAEGEEGSVLRRLHDAREAARMAWLNSAY